MKLKVPYNPPVIDWNVTGKPTVESDERRPTARQLARADVYFKQRWRGEWDRLGEQYDSYNQ